MTFEEVVDSLNKRGIFMVDLTQLENGKKWSVRVWSKTKLLTPAATGKTIELAVKGALAHMKAQMTDKEWAEVKKAQKPSVPKKRVKSR
jgi:hypothetical protein